MSVTRCLRDEIELPPETALWIFAYGSLMWHPGFPHDEVRLAVLHGYHRRFCVYSHRYRGTPERPGLVLGLDRGGHCRGLAYRVPAGERASALDYLEDRELLSRAYRPRVMPVTTPQGKVPALCFLVDRQHAQYTGRLSLAQTAELIARAAGQRGTCSDYLTNTVRHLEGLGVGAGHLRPLLQLVERSCGQRP